MGSLDDWLIEDWFHENPMPTPQGLVEAPGRRLAADRGETYDPDKHRPSWEQIAAAYDDFDRALADWRRRYIEFRLRHSSPALPRLASATDLDPSPEGHAGQA